MAMKKWYKTPKAYVIFAMLAYLLIASIGYKSIIGIENGLVAVMVAVIVDVACMGIKNRKWNFPDGAIITGLIISLILSTSSSFIIISATAAISILSKYLFVYKKRPIFNPAALGLLLSILFFQTGQSWWGAFGDLPAWTILFLVIGGYIITNRVNKFPQVFAFLGTTFLLLVLMGHFNIGDAMDAFRPPFINATIFFGFFMLTDLPTSPGKDRDQMIFGMLTAVVGTIVYAIFGGLTYLFIGLLVGNLYTMQKKRSSAKMIQRSNLRKTQRSLS